MVVDLCKRTTRPVSRVPRVGTLRSKRKLKTQHSLAGCTRMFACHSGPEDVRAGTLSRVGTHRSLVRLNTQGDHAWLARARKPPESTDAPAANDPESLGVKAAPICLADSQTYDRDPRWIAGAPAKVRMKRTRRGVKRQWYLPQLGTVPRYIELRLLQVRSEVIADDR